MEHFLYKRLNSKSPKINLWFAFPQVESFALSSVGYLNIFKQFDLNPDLFIERIYQDTVSPLINPKDVDAMGFSVSFELDILNIIKMLQKYNFPLKYDERGKDDPFIFAGGPVLMSNFKPFEKFFDFISIGEKVCLEGAIEVLKEKNNLNRDDILKKLSNVEGIYVPKYPKKTKIVRDNLEDDIVYSPILSSESYFKNTFIIEIERGCPKMCNFCLASWLNLPVRFIKYEKIIEAIDLGLKHTNKIALLGAYVAGHPDFKKIIDYIYEKSKNQDIELSISSLRADNTDEDLIKTLVKCNQKTATIALEAGSQRLRDIIKKDLSESQILNTIKIAKKNGLKGLKIYVMIGHPTEEDKDIEELIDLIQKMKEENKKQKGAFDITISASTFIPKPHTPFEDVKRFDKKILEKRIKYLSKELHKIGITFRSPSIEWDMVQSILSRYNEDLSDFLIEVVENGANLGAFKQLWRKEFKKGKLPEFEEASIFPLNNIETPAWDLIDTNSSDLKINRKTEFSNLYRL